MGIQWVQDYPGVTMTGVSLREINPERLGWSFMVPILGFSLESIVFETVRLWLAL